TIADDNVDEIETLDNHNNKIETTDNHADGIEIVDDHEDMLEDDESLEFDFDSVVKSLQQEPINENLPDLAPQRTSEDEHCRIFLNPYISPIFLKKNNNYEVQLNRAVKGTKQRPDLSCVVDNVALLNSEIKPMGSRPLNKKKDFSKVHLRARKTINQQLTSKGGPGETAMLLNHGLFFYTEQSNCYLYLLNHLSEITGDIVQTYFMDLEFDGLYRSWPFLTTKLAIDEPSLPLIESNFAHFVALE
ncbi:7290_t:CDS:2, partial [Racocetra fulgida]